MPQPRERIQIALNWLSARLGSRGRVPVAMSREGEVWRIRVEGREFLAPGPRRWRLYRRGVEARLASVARRCGLHDLSPEHEGEWALDVGGYMGEWSLHMLRQGFKVLAIEPDPLAARCLRENLTRHAPKDAVWLHDPRVAYSEAGRLTFHSAPSNADGSIFASDKHASTALEVEAQTLDRIVAEQIGDGRVGVMKMDAEGAEPEVLQGPAAVLAQLRRIGIDVGPEREGEPTRDGCRRVLGEAGFRFREDLEPDDGVVTAERRPANA